MRSLSFLALAIAAGALTFASAQAHSPRYHHHARHAYYPQHEITVHKRSFLDPGNVVPVGSENRYMVDNTYFVRTPGGTYRNDNFGAGIVPGPFDLPGYLPGYPTGSW